MCCEAGPKRDDQAFDSQGGTLLKREFREKEIRRAQVRRCNRDLNDLKSQLSRLSAEMSAVVEVLEQHQSRLANQDWRLETVEQTVHDILTGRIWKTLEAIGRLPRKLFRRR
jgi:chromosome segregation ATPase